MANPLILLVGQSASGKTSVAEVLESKYKLKSLRSYTTRKPRYDGEDGHVFISNEDFDKLEDIIAYTEYNNNRYCATKEQLDASDIYVVDPHGVETLLNGYPTNRHIYIFYLNTNIRNRIDRMYKRGSSDTEIVNRLYVDEEYNWFDRLKIIVWRSFRKVYLYDIDADKPIEDVVKQIMNSVVNKEVVYEGRLI